jgi:hypothetical protein
MRNCFGRAELVEAIDRSPSSAACQTGYVSATCITSQAVNGLCRSPAVEVAPGDDAAPSPAAFAAGDYFGREPGLRQYCVASRLVLMNRPCRKTVHLSDSVGSTGQCASQPLGTVHIQRSARRSAQKQDKRMAAQVVHHGQVVAARQMATVPSSKSGHA